MLSGSLMWRLTLPLLVTMVLLTACSGGGDNGGGSNGGGGGGNDNGDGNGGDGSREPTTVVSLVNVSLEIIPFGDSFNITLHNYQSFATDDIRGINITAIAGDSKTSQFISLSNLTGNAVTFVLANLDSGQRYNFSVSVINNTDGSLRPTRIVFVEQQNAEDHAAGGIYLGPNFDGDYQADEVDEDDDNDNLLDTEEVDADNNSLVVNGIMCSLLVDCDKDGLADNHTREQLENSDGMKCLLSPDCDGDDVTDADEVEDGCVILADCDGDDVNDDEDNCPTDSRDWSSNPTDDPDSDGCHNEDDSDDDNDNLADNHPTEQLENSDGIMCLLLADCDKDGLADNHPTEQLENSKGESCSLLMDCDNDSLADNHTTEQLVNEDGVRCLLLADCDNDRLADNTTREQLSGGGTSCSILADCDGDHVMDADEVEDKCVVDTDCDDDHALDGDELPGCVLKPNCDDDGVSDHIDVDDDGDGLIEISTAAALDAVRWVLDGTGKKTSETAMPNSTGCGDGTTVTACNGYELVRDISLSDHIAETHATAGWQPIASDVNRRNDSCDGGSFTAIFDGNGFVLSGLFINRPEEDCIGLFGLVTGSIRHLGVVAAEIKGRNLVGGLAGAGAFGGQSASIIRSYAVTDEVRGSGEVGGLVGFAQSVPIVHSYAVTGGVRGSGSDIGGLVGGGTAASIVQSYAVTGRVDGDGEVGGLVGRGQSASIVQSYAVTGRVDGGINVGGLVGQGSSASIVHAYAVAGRVDGRNNVGGLVGDGGTANFSYWDTDTGGRTNSAVGSGQTSEALRMPTDYTDIYVAWDAGAISEGDTIAGVGRDATIWCDENRSGLVDADERRDGNRIWDFGTATDYPALRCVGDSLADQRAWWSLSGGKPQLNEALLNATIEGSYP